MTLNDVYGQEDAVERLRTLAERAKKNQLALPGMLFIGYDVIQAGRLAQAFAGEVNTGYKETNGHNIDSLGELAAILTKLQDGDILFLGYEGLNNECIPIIKQSIEEHRIELVIGKGAVAKSICLELPISTLILFFNTIDDIPKSLLDIFPEFFPCTNYHIMRR